MADQVKSLRGLAIRGILAKPRRHEAFINGSMGNDTMVLVFASMRRRQVSPRKWERVTTTRIVKCELRLTPDGCDYWWQGTDQNVLSHTG